MKSSAYVVTTFQRHNYSEKASKH